MNEPRYWLIVPAAGVGRRMQAGSPKQYLEIAHRYVLDITLSRLLNFHAFAGCMVALDSADQWWPLTEAAADSRVSTCRGGSQRADSVLAALQALSPLAEAHDWVLVHDAARPCLAGEDLDRLIAELSGHSVGGLLAAPVADTLKRTFAGSRDVSETVDRGQLWRALTPQMFRFANLFQALESALAAGFVVTDEASAMEYSGQRPRIVEGRPDNIKITLPADLALAGFILDRL